MSLVMGEQHAGGTQLLGQPHGMEPLARHGPPSNSRLP